MSRKLKFASGVVAVLFLLGVVVLVQGEEIALGLVGFMIKQQSPVGPNQDVSWSSGLDPRGRAPEERPPNIILILADDLGWNDLTFGGGGVAGGTVPTPHIDSIAAEGVNFTNGYAANGTCAPSRAALMSGRYGTRFGFEFTPTPPGIGKRSRRRAPGRGFLEPSAMIAITPQMRVLVCIEPADFRKGIDGIARLCKEALAEDLARAVGVEQVKGSRPLKGRALRYHEVVALFDACARDESPAGTRDAVILALGLGAGLRRAEIVGLQVSDVKLDQEIIRVLGKGRKIREVPVKGGTLEAIRRWL